MLWTHFAVFRLSIAPLPQQQQLTSTLHQSRVKWLLFSFLSFFTLVNHRSTYQNLCMLSNTWGVFWSPQKAGLPLGIRHSWWAGDLEHHLFEQNSLVTLLRERNLKSENTEVAVMLNLKISNKIFTVNKFNTIHLWYTVCDIHFFT